MDSERKHELETNDLKEFLDNFKDFWEKHGNKLLLFLIVVLGGYAGYNYYNQWKTGQVEEAQQALEGGATSPQALLAVAEEHDGAHDEAMRRAGDMYLAEARAADVKGDSKDAKKALDKARSAYTALTSRGKSDAYKIAGHEGLAMVEIEAENWKEAQAQFKKMEELAGDRYLPQAARAKAGPDMIDLIRNPIAFAEEDDLSFDPDAIPDGPAPDADGEAADGDSIVPDIIDPADFDSTIPPVDPGN